MPNVLSLSGFPGLKNLSQKCLFLKSLVFRELAGFTGRVLNKLKRGEEKRGKERKKEERSGREEETKRGKEEERGKERKGEEETKDERRKVVFLKH